ncbi:MAG: phosphate regulon sensor histidine kinase PhoR [Gammaproteobacteria bacterium]|jgi:two-component system phosphate regulon sensor histidine kinase PhoR|nr:phosphate regulon sensor histidine kinase PhoR [Gammaproteobacteria bacterium]
MTNWHSELHRILVLLGLCIVFGFLIDRVQIVLLLGLSAYTFYNLFQLRRLTQWVAKDSHRNDVLPPEGGGIWGAIFDNIYKLQKQERLASDYLKSILNKAQESSAALEIAVVMINKQGTLDWWNRATEELLGIRYPNDRNQAVTNLIRDPRFADYFHREKYDQTLRIEAPTKGGRTLEFQLTLFGEHEKLMLVRDVTQLHRLEAMRRDFVGNVSHELGTPITVIKGYLETIIDHKDSLDPRWHKPLEQMRSQSQRMENIVRDLLVLSSIETRSAPRVQDRISLRDLIQEIENESREIVTEKDHQLIIDLDADIEITGQRSELYSALSNLVINAAKYTPNGGRITLRAALEGGDLKIEIEDNGIGIAAQHIPRLTERFYRVDPSRSAETGGTGLGLAIVKHILARHDAELEIESTVGKGSLFRCWIPKERLS